VGCSPRTSLQCHSMRALSEVCAWGLCLEQGRPLSADPPVPLDPGCPLARGSRDPVPQGRRDRRHDPLHGSARAGESSDNPCHGERVLVCSIGEGQIWRKDDAAEQTTVLEPGVSIDIPVGTAFQYRCTGLDPLQFLCITMPRWPGDQEATVIAGPLGTECSQSLTGSGNNRQHRRRCALVPCMPRPDCAQSYINGFRSTGKIFSQAAAGLIEVRPPARRQVMNRLPKTRVCARAESERTTTAGRGNRLHGGGTREDECLCRQLPAAPSLSWR
jgi:hypothetical protein